MSQSDDALAKALSRNGKFDAERGRESTREAAEWFAARLRKVERITFVYHILLGAVGVFYMIRFQATDDVKTMLGYACIIGAVLAGLVVMKLWYWVMNSKISILRDIELLRLDLTARGVLAPDTEPLSTRRGTRFSTIEAGRSRKRLLWWIVLVGIMFAVALLASGVDILGYGIVAQEEAEWRISASDVVRARSRLRLVRWPANAVTVDLALPYSSGKVESVTIGGESISFREIEPGKVRVDLPRRWRAYLTSKLQVDWTFPSEALEKDSRGQYRAILRGLVPVESYSLVVELDPDSGFECIGDPSARRLTLFRGMMRRPIRKVGSCGLMIRETAAPETKPGPR